MGHSVYMYIFIHFKLKLDIWIYICMYMLYVSYFFYLQKALVQRLYPEIIHCKKHFHNYIDTCEHAKFCRVIKDPQCKYILWFCTIDRPHLSSEAKWIQFIRFATNLVAEFRSFITGVALSGDVAHDFCHWWGKKIT